MRNRGGRRHDGCGIRTSTRRHAALLIFLVGVISQPAAATYDVVADFSRTVNPNGPWAYGWKANLGGAFFPNTTPDSNVIVPGVDFWLGPDNCGFPVWFPFVGFNNTGATLDYGNGISQPASVLNLHPSCTGKFSVVRWTAPTAGFFKIDGRFLGIDTRHTTTDVHVWKNSATVLLSANISVLGDQATFSLAQNFAAGDTLDFAVGIGANGNFFNDSTGLAVTITSAHTVCLLYDPAKEVQSGATHPIKVQLCDGQGNNLSSSAISLRATTVTQISTSASGPAAASGNANPGNYFRFDQTLGSGGGYIFNLNTRGLPAGDYDLNFTVDGSGPYRAPFRVR